MVDSASGLLLLDKPSGPTSFDCVRMARRVLQEKRIGHCGTLDPMAQGVLVLLFGRSTRRQNEFLAMEKQYWFRCELGRITDSGDRMGKTLETLAVPSLTRDDLEAAAKGFLGESLQIPPKVSAIKYKGKRLYEWTRKGIEVPRAPRSISIYSFEILSLEGNYFEARVVCSRGTYIRTLVEDVARKMGTGGTVDALIRERVGTYRRENAMSWETLCTSSRESLLTLAQA
jgi:tRNA pseudouridine55 synthase